MEKPNQFLRETRALHVFLSLTFLFIFGTQKIGSNKTRAYARQMNCFLVSSAARLMNSI